MDDPPGSRSTKPDPDYAGCSLAELTDIRRHIDADRYPERAEAIDAIIRTRLAAAPKHAQRFERRFGETIVLDLTKRGIGIYFLVSGGISLGRFFPSARLTGEGGVAGLLYLLPSAVYGLTILAGVLLVRRYRAGMPLGLMAAMLQIPLVRLWRFTYTLTSLPTVELKLHPQMGVAFSATNTVTLGVAADPQPAYLGINLAALLVFTLLTEDVRRTILAYRRLQHANHVTGAAGENAE